MRERVILADCCEDWIIEWGGFYETGGAFRCPECGTGWIAAAPRTYRRADGREFERRERAGSDASFAYLAARDGEQPDVERCCAKILLSHGPRLTDGSFACPVCGAVWERLTQRMHGFQVPVFTRPDLPEALAIQPGRHRPFLVGVSGYSPPRD